MTKSQPEKRIPAKRIKGAHRKDGTLVLTAIRDEEVISKTRKSLISLRQFAWDLAKDPTKAAMVNTWFKNKAAH